MHEEGNGFMRFLWNNIEKFAAFAAFLCAVPALIFSVLSWDVSQRAMQLAQQDFLSARTLILKADYNMQRESFHWLPVGEGVTLQTCTVTFPPSLHLSRESIISPDFDLPLSELKTAMRKIIERTVHRPAKDKSLVSLQNLFPVLVETTYLAKGEILRSKSCYNLMFSLAISDRERTPPQIDFRSALFLGNSSNMPDDFLDTLWDRQLKKLADGK